MSQFEELLKSLEATADEQNDGAEGGADDETIAAAAADSGVDAGEGNPEDDDADAGAAEGKTVAKSLTATGADGDEIEVVDATEMLKSLEERQTEQGDVLAKAMTAMTTALQKQGELIKSLRAEVKTLGGMGRGRKAVVSVAEKPATGATMAKSEGAATGVTKEQFLAKCLSAQKAGALTLHDVARAEIAINNGVPVPADIVSRIQ